MIERHSLLKKDPPSNLGKIRPTNEMAEKEKFQMYWESNKNNTKAKQYNPRFQYEDAQGA
jgi:hypothetical protein